jgi:hypothetical protein
MHHCAHQQPALDPSKRVVKYFSLQMSGRGSEDTDLRLLWRPFFILVVRVEFERLNALCIVRDVRKVMPPAYKREFAGEVVGKHFTHPFQFHFLASFGPTSIGKEQLVCGQSHQEFKRMPKMCTKEI